MPVPLPKSPFIELRDETYPLLRQLPRPLILAVPQQLNHSAFIGRKPVPDPNIHQHLIETNFPVSSLPFLLLSRGGGGRNRKRYYPETSLTISLTNAVRLLKWPLVREIRGLDSRGVIFCFVYLPISHSQELLLWARGWKEGNRVLETYVAGIETASDAALLLDGHCLSVG